MPIYEFRCAVCGMALTVDGSVHGETVAPLCCGQLADRVWSSPGVLFKGTGWGHQG